MTEGTKKVILAVDDAPENLDVVKGILTPTHVVRAAVNGKMALKVIEKQKPDLILLDILMPEMDGYEVCRTLKEDPETHDIPIIFLTAQDQTTDEAKGFGLGAADYIHKPFSPSILKARVETHLALQDQNAVLRDARDKVEEQVRERTGQLVNAQARIEKLVELGIALSGEHDTGRLMENILLEAKSLSRADGGTLYIRTEDDQLKFEIMRSDTLEIALGGTTGKKIHYPSLRLYDLATGEPNHANVATYVALTGA